MLENRRPFSFADLVERVSPAVVTITAENHRDPAPPTPMPCRRRSRLLNQYGQGGQGGAPRAPRKAISAGSGFIIDKAGFVGPTITSREFAQDHGQAARRRSFDASWSAPIP